MDLLSAKDMLQKYLTAEKNILAGKSGSVNGRSFSLENLAEVRAGRKEYEKIVSRLESGRTGPKVRRALINDM